MRKKEQQCISSSSSIDFSNIQKIQNSILQKAPLILSNQQLSYDSMESITYSEIPKIIPKSIKAGFSYAIFLDRFTFYQMFTILIFEHLFKQLDTQKRNKINKLKSYIYQSSFLHQEYYIKALLIKGFKILQNQSNNLSSQNYPAAKYLLTYQILSAFTQCWKQLFIKLSSQQSHQFNPNKEIDSSIFSILSKFFCVDFNIQWKQKNDQFQKQSFYGSISSNKKPLTLIVNPSYQKPVSKNKIYLSDQDNQSIYSNKQYENWNYLILTDAYQSLDLIPIISHENKFNEDIQPLFIKSDYLQNKFQSKKENQLIKGFSKQISVISEAEISYGQTEQIDAIFNNEVMSQKEDRTFHENNVYLNNQKKLVFEQRSKTLGQDKQYQTIKRNRELNQQDLKQTVKQNFKFINLEKASFKREQASFGKQIKVTRIPKQFILSQNPYLKNKQWHFDDENLKKLWISLQQGNRLIQQMKDYCKWLDNMQIIQ